MTQGSLLIRNHSWEKELKIREVDFMIFRAAHLSNLRIGESLFIFTINENEQS